MGTTTLLIKNGSQRGLHHQSSGRHVSALFIAARAGALYCCGIFLNHTLGLLWREDLFHQFSLHMFPRQPSPFEVCAIHRQTAEARSSFYSDQEEEIRHAIKNQGKPTFTTF